MPEPLEPFQHFLEIVARATNETSKREAFIALAATGFSDTQLSTDLALGAEYKVRFSRQGVVRRGAIDSFYGNLIIEFENDLNRTRQHALEQLRGYCCGAWEEDGSAKRAYLAVIADGVNWEVYVPRLRDSKAALDESNVDLQLIEEWHATAQEVAAFRSFLNRVFFRSTLIPPTSGNFVRDFGAHSPAYIRSLDVLLAKHVELGADSQLEVLQTEWHNSLQAAYGHIATDATLFAQHTYLAVLARLLVWAAMEKRHLRVDELSDVLSGLYFEGRLLGNLVEDDFFRWWSIPSGTDASAVFIGLGEQLAGYDLDAISEDILKPLYEELVDQETRHGLGEYYTPDWLATRVTRHLLNEHDWAADCPRVLDPACGSGSFLRAVIHEVSTHFPQTGKALLSEVLSNVIGIDVHPLAVIIARATYVLALKDLLPAATEAITIPVYLANSLSMTPFLTQRNLFGKEEFALMISGQAFRVPAALVQSGADFDDVIEVVLTTARAYGGADASLDDIHASVAAAIGNRLEAYEDSKGLATLLGDMAYRIAELVRARQDSVHGFLLRNHYRPAMIRYTIDYIVGNPPWLTVGDIQVPEYQRQVIERATRTQIAPRALGAQSHTELATLFVAAAAEEYLKRELEGLRVAFVMPRSVFTATHHRNLRQGLYTLEFDVSEIWDLDEVRPLFNVPACVLFISPGAKHPDAPKPGAVYSGTLPEKEVSEETAHERLDRRDATFVLDYLGRRSAWREAEGRARPRSVHMPRQPYVKCFRQGAVLYPQTLFVVDSDGRASRSRKTLRVRTSAAAFRGAKKPTAPTNHIVDTSNLYVTAAADHVLPYVLERNLWTVVLPVAGDPGSSGFGPASAAELRAAGRVRTAEWLEWAELQWHNVRKEGETEPIHERLDYAGHLRSQADRRPFLVLYTAAGKRPVATLVDTGSLPFPFVVRDRTYAGSFESADEAYYLVAFLNSGYVEARIVDFVNRGLFGPRDINKRVLDVPWPIYKPSDDRHRRLAMLGLQLSAQASALLVDAPAMKVGRKRTWLRTRLDAALVTQLESLCRSISGSRRG